MARSPNYPGVGLPDAIERIRKIHLKAHTHKVDAETMAKAAGYSSMNGSALTTLSALKKYLLLEEIGKELRVSPLAMTIIADPISALERKRAIQAAAFAPVLFEDIRKQYPGNVPGDEIVRSYLLKKGFLASAVDGAIRPFRETIALVTAEGLGYNETIEFPVADESATLPNESQMNTPPAAQSNQQINQNKSSTSATVAVGHKRDTFSLEKGQAALEWPEELTADSFEDFESWIQLQLKKIKRSIQ